MSDSNLPTSARIRQDFLDFFRGCQHTIVPSSSLMPDSPNLLFTNAGMNQFVPIFLGQQPCPYRPARAADTQKCIRAGGKHNDLEDVGLDTYHHTFFEMLGNWSFGDYFKREAIAWAWELVTGVWRFPKHRLYATVYSPDPARGDPSQFDQEAYDCWAEHFVRAGLDPRLHIRNGGKKDNFWMMGDTGPCGPCSELHVDLTPAGDSRGELVNAGSPKCMEIWNLVFMQYNANADGGFSPLPARSVDTGLGFERVAGIIQCTRQFNDFSGVISNYETDVFRPIFSRIEQLSGRRYGSTLPRAGSTGDTAQEKTDVAFRVIADHIRTLGFAIADGIAPGNTDRHYVLRRILRRAVRYGRTLGFHEPFFHRLVVVLAETMGHVFPEIRKKQKLVEETIRTEEESFNKTLDRGIELFDEAAAAVGASRSFPAAEAFRLYDTYGFPLDLTELMARERGMTVEKDEFHRLMDEQRTKARAARKKEVIELSQVGTQDPTRFVGYDRLETPSRVLEAIGFKGQTAVILEESACYAEMGGQVGDTGELVAGEELGSAGPGARPRSIPILNTRRNGDTWLHMAPAEANLEPGEPVLVRVDRARRAAIQRHHTVTHLLHWAIHEVVSRDATQKGSYVGPEKLTFDFNSAALTPAQVADIERLVNERIVENAPVSWAEVPYQDLEKRPDIMQIFGEKYGSSVRVIQIGGQPLELNGYSMELCGGTHCRATGEIGLFRIVSEGAIAAGIRRIEALAGLEAYRRAGQELALLRTLSAMVNSPVAELEKKIEAIVAQQKELERQLRESRQKQAADTAASIEAQAQDMGATRAIVANLGRADAEFLQAVIDTLKGRFEGVVVLGATDGGAVSLAASVAPGFTRKIQAGKIIQTIAPLVGGKGGGRPDFARGGGKDPAGLEKALQQARQVLSGL
ncbi:MAG TPA: alanine--tRNA ligase [Candidatus Paceibacterota bacterium]|nr:alanine--tRNA ligase [Verrucomicrobiota bacterium]HRZ45639.1 alanine--tRNA ligase [Candidatus Paceibacterota bacterium]